MNRHAIKRLEHWKDSKGRKPMIIRGARQVGKTWLMKEFGRTRFAKTAYVNFENNDRAKAIFEMDFDIARMILALSAETGAGMGSSNKVSGRKRKDKLSVDTGSFGMIRYPRTDAKAAAPSMEK